MWLFFLVTGSVLMGMMMTTGSHSAPPGTAQTLQSLHCPPCERLHCATQRRALKLQCPGGITTGVCGCCPACARLAGEPCGGTWDHLGKCDRGLVCVLNVQHHDDDDDITDRKLHENTGSCTAVLESQDEENCLPECSKDFCQANPSEICSARFVSVQKQPCHGSCQHTSCSGCLLLKAPPPACSRPCSPNDTSCLRQFGRCIHNHLASPLHPVCHSLPSHPEGYFMCLVPSCPHAPS